MSGQQMPEVLAEMRATPSRRVAGLFSLLALACLLIYVVLTRPPEQPWQILLLGLGLGAFWVALKMYHATASAVLLTDQGLHDADGTLIVALADIRHVDRGFLAFKPSHGIVLRAATAGGAQWRPGLWWRIGTRIGIGGMTPAHQAKTMSRQLDELINTAENENTPQA
ncbi:MAG: hypothetical protein WBB25_12030 [Sulfitobacter sp.]